MEDASEWVVSRVYSASADVVRHLLFVVPSLTLTTNRLLVVEDHGFDAFLFKSTCCRKACWSSANNADWLWFFMSAGWKCVC